MIREQLPNEEDNVLEFGKSHFRPCGVTEEFLDDPLEELLNEFSVGNSGTYEEIEGRESDLEQILAEAQQSMSPTQQLRLSIIKAKKSLRELHYYNRELRIHLGL